MAELINIFEKRLTADDLRKRCLRIPKKKANTFDSIVGADITKANASFSLSFVDQFGKAWEFNYTYWKSIRSYQLDGNGWIQYVHDMGLKEGDVVLIKRHRFHDERLFIHCTHLLPTAEYSGGVVVPPTSTTTTTLLPTAEYSGGTVAPPTSTTSTPLPTAEYSGEAVAPPTSTTPTPPPSHSGELGAAAKGNSSLVQIYSGLPPLIPDVEIGELVTNGPAQQGYSNHLSAAMIIGPLDGITGVDTFPPLSNSPSNMNVSVGQIVTANFNTEASNPTDEVSWATFMRDYNILEDQRETAAMPTDTIDPAFDKASSLTMRVSREASILVHSIMEPERLNDMVTWPPAGLATNKPGVGDPAILNYFMNYQHLDSKFARQMKSLLSSDHNEIVTNYVMMSVGTIMSILLSTDPVEAISPHDCTEICKHRQVLRCFGMEVQLLDEMIKSRPEPPGSLQLTRS